MTHKERALAPFLRKSMDRFPLWYKGAPETTDNIRCTLGAVTDDDALYSILDLDYKTINPSYNGPKQEYYADGTWLNEWGVRRGGYHYGIPLSAPLSSAETPTDVKAYPSPDPTWYDVKITEEQKVWTNNYCVIGGYWGPLFSDATELLGMENFFIQMYTNEKLVYAVLDKCYEFYYELDRLTFEANPGIIDMYFICNDFGTQQNLFVSPDMWRKFFKPYIKSLIEQAKKYGCVTTLHSCGAISGIINDLIDCGIDAINPIQVNAVGMEPEKLINEFKDDCVFFGGIDENDILLHRSENEVRDETRRIIDILGKYGRYIVAASHDYLLPEVPVRNIIAMYDEAKKYGLGHSAMTQI